MIKSVKLENEVATSSLAKRISKHLQKGDCLLLSGPIGAGKSHFARSIIQSIMAKDGEIEDVPSPTFTLVQMYETRSGEIWHADLYRLSDVDELAELGLDDAFENAITLVEWPERLGPYRPLRHVLFEFIIPENDPYCRMLNITTAGQDWDWLDKVIYS